jgi:hypothetical protein
MTFERVGELLAKSGMLEDLEAEEAERVQAQRSVWAAELDKLGEKRAEQNAVQAAARQALVIERTPMAERIRQIDEKLAVLPQFDAEGSVEEFKLRCALERTAVPEISEFATWCERAFEFARLQTPPFVTDANGRNGGFDQSIRSEIQRCMAALREAASKAHALKLLAIPVDEVLGRLREIHANLPPAPPAASDGLARRPALPDFLRSPGARDAA